MCSTHVCLLSIPAHTIAGVVPPGSAPTVEAKRGIINQVAPFTTFRGVSHWLLFSDQEVGAVVKRPEVQRSP